MEAKNDTASGGGTLPRLQRQAKRTMTTKIDLPPKQPLFNTDYTAEALKQMSMYYSNPQEMTQMCGKVEKCYIDNQTVHYGRQAAAMPFHHQMMYQQQQQQQQQHHPAMNYKVYAGQMHQTQAEVHVEHSQSVQEVCMVSELIVTACVRANF